MRRIGVAVSLVLLGCVSGSPVTNGDKYFAEKDYDSAVAAYEAALKNDPVNAELNLKLSAARRHSSALHQGLAEVALDRGDLDLAYGEIKVALLRDPNNDKAQAVSRRIASLHQEIQSQIERARRSMNDREYQNSYKVLESISKYQKTYPEISILLGQVADRYCRDLLDAAQSLGRAGDWTKAYGILDHASEVAVRVPELQSNVKATQVDIRVMELVDQGLKLKSQDDLVGALNRFETAYKLKPEAIEVVEAYTTTRHAVALTYVTRANEAAEAKQPLLAYTWLRKAMDVEPESVTEIKSTICHEAAKALILKSEEAFRKGLVGLEWLRLKQAQAIDPEHPKLDKYVKDTQARLDKAIRPTILVEKFQNASRFQGHEIRLASEAYRQLQAVSSSGKLATVLDEGALRIHKQENEAFVPEIVVRGTLERFEIVHHPDAVQNESKEFFAENTYFDVFTNKETRVTEKRVHNYNIVTKKVQGVARLVYEVYDTENKAALSSGVLDETFSKEDKVVAGNKQAGVAEDPLELPADAVLAEQLYNALKDRLLSSIQADLGWTGKKLYAMYQKAKESDDADAAVSYAVLSARSLSACAREPLAQDLDYILKKTGYSLKDGKINPDFIR
jgi:tetratricopeptide (TPR) repeat protein